MTFYNSRLVFKLTQNLILANMFNVRRWVNVLNPKKANLSANNVKIMSYNVLSQTQLEKHFYLYKDNHPDDLDWNQRWLLLLFDFKYHDSDVSSVKNSKFSTFNCMRQKGC